MKRKEFLKFSALAVAGVALGGSSFIESCAKSTTSPSGPTVNFTIDLTKASYAALNTVGGYLYANGVIVARATSTTFIALSQACTHQGCTIAFNSGMNNFVCPCHGGTYDFSGNVTGGPPPAPVKSYSVTKSGNILTIAG
ncbi:MAG: Rieske (2Fe-2S) protein [Bacteroidota bacterium]